jgi:uncharacterized membrane-anchored protein YhcB (DUF1043 family)
LAVVADEENRSQDLVEGGSDVLWASAEVKKKRSEITELIHHLAAEQDLAKKKVAKAEEEAKLQAEEEARKKTEEEEEVKKRAHALGAYSGLMRSRKPANPQRGPVPNDKTNPEVID